MSSRTGSWMGVCCRRHRPKHAAAELSVGLAHQDTDNTVEVVGRSDDYRCVDGSGPEVVIRAENQHRRQGCSSRFGGLRSRRPFCSGWEIPGGAC